ncbi:major capsid protein [Alteromonas pelagimontana]|uniref:Major capsid protein n=1 Tax=Alteromonas pelagimontana TaxID=1858656 RepID=A0A6M4MAB4_9ALTE|nr:major capsid protein [Alteromonas pelagimontana]QJR79610.1 major capsid protein [Alteromonas pelagimontana]
MFNAVSTSTMLEIVQTVGKFESFFLSLFFPSVITFDDEYIHFDKVSEDVVMAPFVSPVVAGKVHKERGGELKTFKPAYLKPKHAIKPGQLLKRRPGEAFLGSMSPAQRKMAALTDNLVRQDKAITYREEWMAAQAVLTGKVLVKGEDYPDQEVDFGRSAGNNIALSGAAKWDTVDPATYDPTDDITNWAENATGSVGLIVMGKGAWTKFSSFKSVKEKLDTLRGSSSQMETATKDLGMVTSFKGYFGDVEIWVYTGQYTDPETNEKEYYMPANKILMGNAAYSGVRAYGAIHDVKANDEGVVAASRWPKTWAQDDPSVEYVMTQSAPLMITPDPDAFVSVTVF